MVWEASILASVSLAIPMLANKLMYDLGDEGHLLASLTAKAPPLPPVPDVTNLTMTATVGNGSLAVS